MHNRFRRIFTIVRKETIQLLRDRRTLIFILGLPMIELFLFAYAVTLSVNHIPTAVVDQSHGSRARDFINALQRSEYFDMKMVVANEQEIIQAIDSGQVKAGLVIPADFSAHIASGDANVLILLDGSDSFSVQSGYSAASAISQTYQLNLITEKVSKMGAGANSASSTLPVDTSFRVLYNPDMNDMIFVLPGIAAIILQVLAVGQSAMTVVRERELGTLEQIMVTPTRPIELMLGKLIPNMVLNLVVTVIILILGVFFFGMPFHGSVWLFFALAILFIISGIGLGLMISSVAKTQRQAQQMSMVLMLFSMLLTGVIYPRAPMPWIAQAIGSLIPLTYFIRISRGIITKGVGISLLWSDVVALIVYGVVVMIIASVSFKRRLD